MSFDLLSRLRHNFSVRLNFWYALIFTASSMVLCALVYYLLAAAIVGKDREVLEARLKEYSFNRASSTSRSFPSMAAANK